MLGAKLHGRLDNFEVLGEPQRPNRHPFYGMSLFDRPSLGLRTYLVILMRAITRAGILSQCMDRSHYTRIAYVSSYLETFGLNTVL